MKHQICERFQGMWWGAIVGQALANQNNSGEHPGIITFPEQNWLEERRRIAEILLRSSRLEEIRLPTLTDHIISLSALIIFYEDNQHLFSQIINSGNLKLANSLETTELKEDILTWSYLLNSLLNNEFESWQLNHNLVVERMLNNLEGQETRLIQQFKYVVTAINHGKSLHNLLDKLLSNGNMRQTQIALSWYCFVTTPHDFRISVKRAALIQPATAGLLAALTGTFSGAYNGVIGIPRSWVGKISHYHGGKWSKKSVIQGGDRHQKYLLENEVLVKLCKAWLGIYAPNSNQELYNQELDAVANPKMIQPRQTLNIISQKPRFHSN